MSNIKPVSDELKLKIPEDVFPAPEGLHENALVYVPSRGLPNNRKPKVFIKLKNGDVHTALRNSVYSLLSMNRAERYAYAKLLSVTTREMDARYTELALKDKEEDRQIRINDAISVLKKEGYQVDIFKLSGEE
jgi:hypothetical protein